MSWDKIDEQWKQATGKVREEWGMLTERDLTMIGGSKDRLIDKIQEKYGIARDDVEKQVDQFASAHFSTESGGT
jgi:uncharacterized protein YjbJ (UPF0337 family)